VRRTVVFLAALLAAISARAEPFPVLAGDPIDPASGRAYAILPGMPLLLPQPDGKFDPPIVVPGTIGDVDLVVRAGTPVVGATMPAPVATPPVAVAGGTQVVSGSEIPFTVIVSDGAAGAGSPLLGAEMDGLPAIVFVFADLDGDGVVGPTNADGDPVDNLRELQESEHVVGRRAAIFENGVASGTVAVSRGAPASAGGLRVVLTAAAYVGPFVPGFFEGNVPDGPGVATLLPFFPRIDPERVVESEGRGGPATPEVRLGVELESEFDPPVDDPVLGTPFALPTDGSSPTVDRALVHAGTVSRVRFTRASVAAGFPVDVPVTLLPGAAGALLEPVAATTLADDGPGGAATFRLVPVDGLDNVTDPATPLAATLVATGAVRITAPDADGDPARESVAVGSAAGIDVVVDDTGGPADGGGVATLTAELGGFAVDQVRLDLGGAPPGGSPPSIVTARIAGDPASLVANCPVSKTLIAVVADPDGDATRVDVTVTLDGQQVAALTLGPGTPPGDLVLPPGAAFTGTLRTPAGDPGALTIAFTARDAGGRTSAPAVLGLPLDATASPIVRNVAVVPPSVVAGVRTELTVTATVADDCGIKRASLEADRGKGFRRFVRLRDDGRKGDLVAGDGIFTGMRRWRSARPATIPTRARARNRLRVDGLSNGPDLQVVGP
jgi:hypothetical protein